MALNLSGLAQGSTSALGLARLILVSPQKTVGYQPQNAPSWQKNTAPQGKAILFNYEGEQNVSLSSDITDHYIENNTAIQDQIAIKPEIITTQGFVGELNNIPPDLLQPLKTAAEKLTAISGYLPSISVTAQLLYLNAFQAYQVAKSTSDSLVSGWASINGGAEQSVINGSGVTGAPNQTQQQIYFQQFYAYWKSRTLFTIQTPWAVFQDMAIQSLRAVQNADTRMISDFEVTFKLMRFAATQEIVTALYTDNNNMQDRAQNQSAPEVDLGTSTLQPSTTTLGPQLP